MKEVNGPKNTVAIDGIKEREMNASFETCHFHFAFTMQT